MNKKLQQTINYEIFDSLESMPQADRDLYQQAIAATEKSHSPYSQFKVGAALLLDTGEIIDGANQENMAYPSGLCAERVVAYGASASHPGKKFVKLAIAARNANGDLVANISPCGSCRQSLLEFELKFENDIEILIPAGEGRIMKIESIKQLLPFHFSF
ncbi:MAG: cytidine deaminase [Cyclobacteriaceae bacterium]|nr:cytidine deaminase [Cyclobacteriaceae bacterium]MCH8516578.1 cytidine deaminase [Cyclobacteriaceae bacterium]